MSSINKLVKAATKELIDLQKTNQNIYSTTVAEVVKRRAREFGITNVKDIALATTNANAACIPYMKF